jgi:hypothetical protein
VDTLQPGEYTLAVWDRLYLNAKALGKPEYGQMKIYPNPAKGFTNIELNTNTKTWLSIYDSLGKQISNNPYTTGLNVFKWDNPAKASSVYFLKLSDLKGNLLESCKVVFE